MDANSSKTHYIVLMIICLGLISAMAFSIYNQARSLKRTLDELAGQKALLAQQESWLRSLSQYREQEDAILDLLANFAIKIPLEIDDNTLFNYLHAVNSYPNSYLSDIRFAEQEPKGEYTEIPFKITYDGRYHGLLAFLTNLKEGPLAVRVDDISITRGKSGLPQIRANISLAAFLMAEI